jgi:hypothetical protein
MTGCAADVLLDNCSSTQDYLITIEMFVASIAFTYAFTPKDYQLNSKTRVSCRVFLLYAPLRRRDGFCVRRLSYKHTDRAAFTAPANNVLPVPRSVARTAVVITSTTIVSLQNAEDEAKPFLSAFLQSSVPDDLFSDLK